MRQGARAAQMAAAARRHRYHRAHVARVGKAPAARALVDGIAEAKMRWPRPKSLSGLMLLGLALIAVPLLFAVGDAAFQIRNLSATSQQLVLEGVQSARLSRSLIADIASMERTIRLYQVLPEPRLLDAYRRTDQSLAAARTQLAE